jgi:hypothetical protein
LASSSGCTFSRKKPCGLELGGEFVAERAARPVVTGKTANAALRIVVSGFGMLNDMRDDAEFSSLSNGRNGARCRV